MASLCDTDKSVTSSSFHWVECWPLKFRVLKNTLYFLDGIVSGRRLARGPFHLVFVSQGACLIAIVWCKI